MQGSSGFRRSSAHLGLLLALGLCLVGGGTAAGTDLDEEPVAFRINLSLDRVSAFSDTLGRSASVAYPMGSSINPAGWDFLREPPFDFDAVGTLTTNYVRFDEGATVTGFAGTAGYRLPEAGSVFATYVRTDSHQATSRQGNDFRLDSDELTVGYSRRLRRGLAVGGSVKLLQSFLSYDDMVMGFPQDTDIDSEGLTLSGGVLAALSEQWLAGFTGSVGWTDSDIDGTLSLPPPPFGPGPMPINENDSVRTVNLRGGLGWQPCEAVGFYGDGQYLHLEGEAGTADVGRILAGVEAWPSEQWVVRLGGSLDTEHQGTASAGLGFYGIENVPIEFAYVYNAFPEVNREFGRSHLLSLSAVVVF